MQQPGIRKSLWFLLSKINQQNQILQGKNYDSVFAWGIFRLSWNEKLYVRYIDRWTHELAVLQGQIGIVLLLSHATVSKRAPLPLFHHILHINKIAREWSERDKEKRKGEKEEEREKQIDRLVARSVIVILGGWMNVFDGHCRLRQRECLKTREMGLGPQEGNQWMRGM